MSFGYQVLGFGAFPNRGVDSYQPAGALWLDGSSDYLTLNTGTPSTDDIYTVSLWLKPSELSDDSNAFQTFFSSNVDASGTPADNAEHFGFDSDGKLVHIHGNLTSSSRGVGGFKTSAAVFRDPTAWGHFVCCRSEATSNYWWNGAALSMTQTTAMDSETVINGHTGYDIVVGGYGSGESSFHVTTTRFDGYLAEVILLDGVTISDASDFGETNSSGIWVPKDPSKISSFNNNGFWLDFSNGADIGNDVSGNNNDFTPTSMDANNRVLDLPVNNTDTGTGNFATINPLDAGSSTTTPTFSNGLTTFTRNGTGSDNQQAYATQPAVGKKYFEFNMTGNNNSMEVGWAAPGEVTGNEGAGVSGWDVEVYLLGQNAAGGSAPWSMYMYEGTAGSATSTTTSLDSGEISTTPRMKFAIDTDAKKYYLGVVDSTYGGWFNTSGVGGQTFSEAAPTGTWTSDERFFPYCFGHSGVAAGTFHFRDDDWTDSAPSGFTAMSTANIPEPSYDPRAYFGTMTWTGNATARNMTKNVDGSNPAATAGAIEDSSGAAWTPDFVWIKELVEADHAVFDVTRTNGTRALRTSNATAEDTDATAVTGLISGGVALGDNSGGYNGTNRNTIANVGWFLKAGGSPSDDSGNSASITVSRSTADHQGFSICKGTKANGTQSFSHGLGAKPEFVIVRDMEDASQHWQVQHKDVTTNMADITTIGLDRTNAASTSSNWWGGEPTPTLQYISNNHVTGTNDFVAYLFRRIPGLIGIGSYVGNGSTNGPHVVIDDGGSGFKPAFVLIKALNRSNNWHIFDSVRDPFNQITNSALFPDSAAAEGGTNAIDFVSNGFKLRTDQVWLNASSSNNYIYLAFAESPFGLNNRAR